MKHLGRVCELMQRDHEVTMLMVTFRPKAVEWVSISRDLDAIAAEVD
jgi:hypothetical protein